MKTNRVVKTNWFNTLNESLKSEGIEHTWDAISMGGIAYGQNRSYTYDNGTKNGIHISIYRETNGMYERPIVYNR